MSTLTIKSNLDNSSLLFCTKVAEKVKQPPCIPFFEAYTYELIARYFGLTEKRIYNAYRSNRYMFIDDCAMLTGNKIIKVAKSVKSLGTSYGHLCEFPNGVIAQIAYTQNMIFNSRALLRFAIILKGESEVAAEIFKVLDSDKCGNHGYLPRKKPWFLQLDEATPMETHEDKPAEPVCPFLNMVMEKTNKVKDAPPVKMQKRKDTPERTRKCIQFDKNGKPIHVWDTAKQAADALGISVYGIYNCCEGRQKTTAGKYSFGFMS